MGKSLLRDNKFEQQIADFKSSLENLFDDICASILIAIPPYGEIISVNHETEELTGYEASELTGMYLSDIFCEDDKPRIKSLFEVSNIENLDFRRLFEHNIIIQKRSKRKIIVDMGIKLKHHSEFTAFVITFQDITDLKNSELEIKKAHNYVNNILTSMTECLFVVDRNYNIKTVNRSALKLIGCESDDILNTCAIPLFDDENLFEKLRNCDEIETTLITKSGQPVPVLALLSPLQATYNEEQLKVLVAVDMTERKKAEKLIAEQQMMLVQSSKMSSLGVMASGIAHEINNPLHIINGNCEILSMLLEQLPINIQGVLDSIKVIDDMTSRIDKIIAGLSSFSRDEQGDPPQISSIANIVKATLMLCETRIQNAGISFILPKIKDQLSIKCRSTQISQVLLNLFNNAYDEVRGHKKPFIELKIEDMKDSVRLSVVNSGRKIAPELCEKIFNPFYTTKPVGEGTGLGLSISKSIVESHSGTLSIDLEKRHTTFVITLPKSGAKNQRLLAG